MTKRNYTTDGVVVHWDSEICAHSGVCVRELPEVFDSAAKPWVSPENASVDQVVATVKNCPTGALTYTRLDSRGVPAEQPEQATVVVTVSPDGPLEVAGKIRVVSADGVTLKEHDRLWLCRCGNSGSKPFCDGSHRKVGFKDPGTAPVAE